MYGEIIEEVAGHLKTAGMEVSIFVDPDLDQVKACYKRGINIIEINTGEYAKKWNTKEAAVELEKIKKTAVYAHKMNIRVLAGHGLTYQNVEPIVEIKEIEELNIGHSIVANASLIGLEKAVINMKKLLEG
jgi:pyridoxine 5-phosphate synthase